jgi:hypothetical protein
MWASLAACRASRESGGMLGCPEAGWEAGVGRVGSVSREAASIEEGDDREGILTVGGVAGDCMHAEGVRNWGGDICSRLRRSEAVVSVRPTEARD